MYLAIASSSEDLERNSSNTHSSCRFYHLHLNGNHFCSLRYSQLHTFHQELQRHCDSSAFNIQRFPGKKFFQLTDDEIEERRLALERYLQSVVQHRLLVSSKYFQDFFLHAQHETCLSQRLITKSTEEISLTIAFLNLDEILLENLSMISNTDEVFTICMKQLHIDQQFHPYLALFFYDDNHQHLNLIRPLFAFESPYLSLKQLKLVYNNPRLILKKSSWNRDDDWILIDHPLLRNLVYSQCIYDIEHSRLFFSNQIDTQFDQYRDENLVDQIIQLAHQSKFYGFVLFPACSMHYFTNGNQIEQIVPCLIALGNYQLICYSNENQQEICFQVTRIRCWKVNWMKDNIHLIFEYLVKKDTLKWIHLYTEQAALISTCLQSMVDEILQRRTQVSQMISSSTLVQQARPTVSNVLDRRTQFDLDRLNNNTLFDQGAGDDDL